MSVRNVRFYTSRGLVPPPIRRGRSGYYAPDHVARLELVRELQGHGFTLAAIEKYVERIPATATPSDIALHLSLLAPVDRRARRRRRRGPGRPRRPARGGERGRQVYAAHGQEVAAELSEVVRTLVWPPFREAGGTAEQLRELVHRLKPLTVAGPGRRPTSRPWTRASRRTTASARTDPRPRPCGVATKRHGDRSAGRMVQCSHP